MKYILGVLLGFQVAVAMAQATLAPLEVTNIALGIPQADPMISFGGLASLRFGPNGQLYASSGSAVLEQTAGLSGGFTNIGAVPSGGSDPGTLNFYQNGQTLVVSNGDGGMDSFGSSPGNLYSLPVPNGTTGPSSIPQATYVGNDSPGGFGTFDFVPTPSGSKLFVDAGNASGSEVDLFNPATGKSTAIITGVPGASASMAVSGGYLYVGNGDDFSLAGGGTGQFERFSISAMFQALKAGTPLSWNSSTVINGTSGETNSGGGAFVDPRGYFVAGGGFTQFVNPDTDIGLVAVSPQGQSYSYAIPSDASGDPMTVVQLSYNAITNQVLVPGYGPQGNQAVVYSASQFGVAATNLLNWTGSANKSWDTASSNWAANVPSGNSNYSASNYAAGDTVIFGDTNPISGLAVPASTAGMVTVSIPGGVNPAATMFTNSGAANGGVDYTICGGPIGGSAALELYGNGTVGGTVNLMSPNTFTGPVVVAAGTLNLQNTAALGNSSGVSVIAGATLQLQQSTGNPVTFGLTASNSNSIPLNLYGTGISSGAGELNSLSGNNVYGGAINVGSGGGQIVSTSTAGNDQLTLGGGVNISTGSTLSVAGPGKTTIAGAGLSAANSGSIQLNSGTLEFNLASGSATVSLGSGATLTVAAGATLQLAGTVSALYDPTSGNRMNVVNQGSVADAGGLTIAGGNQTVGTIAGMASTASGAPTTYSGDTIVAAGASLTADQILQNTLTIGAGATVTIRPSGAGISTTEAAASGTASAADVSESGDPLSAIQAALADGSDATAADAIVPIERLENRVAVLSRLATTDPAFDASLAAAENSLQSLESAWPSSLSSELTEESDAFSVNADGLLLPAAESGRFPAPVPEPPTSILLIIAGLILLPAFRHKERRTK